MSILKATSYDPLKRAIDFIAASVGLVFTAPLQLVIALLVRRNLGSPILFRQDRPGKDEQIFKLVKFRTMKDIDPAKGLIDDADRLTPFGKFLRSTSLDELPSLLNVVKGEMSLVGPRPLLVRYLPRYSATQRRRHEVRPGITGLAQVNGRNTLSWDDKFAMDVEYVDNRSFLLDLKILLQTFTRVLSREGVDQEGGVTMEEFMGNEVSS